MTMWTEGSQHCYGCFRSACVDIEPWAMRQSPRQHAIRLCQMYHDLILRKTKTWRAV